MLEKRSYQNPVPCNGTEGKYEWQARFGGPAGIIVTVRANTRSEARAALKKVLGVDRVPEGTTFRKVVEG